MMPFVPLRMHVPRWGFSRMKTDAEGRQDIGVYALGSHRLISPTSGLKGVKKLLSSDLAQLFAKFL